MDLILREADVMCVALRVANPGVLTRVQSALKAQGVSAEWSPRERLHCTLLTSDIPDDATAQAILRGMSLPLAFSTEGVRVEAWGDYLVLVLDPCPALPRIQTDIFNRALALGLQVSSYAPPGIYRPHVTLGTFPRGSLDGLDGFPTDPLWFDEVVVWNGDYRQVDAARLPKEAGDRLFVEVSGVTRRLVARGGPGSGHKAHKGRPGKQGGSQPSTWDRAYLSDVSSDGMKAWLQMPDTKFVVEDVTPESAEEGHSGMIGYSQHMNRGLFGYLRGEPVVIIYGTSEMAFEGPSGDLEEVKFDTQDVLANLDDLLDELGLEVMPTVSVSMDAGYSFKRLAPEDLRAVERGGPGSGHFGHEGRPGEVGGSQPGDFHSGEPPRLLIKAPETYSREDAERVADALASGPFARIHELAPGKMFSGFISPDGRAIAVRPKEGFDPDADTHAQAAERALDNAGLGTFARPEDLAVNWRDPQRFLNPLRQMGFIRVATFKSRQVNVDFWRPVPRAAGKMLADYVDSLSDYEVHYDVDMDRKARSGNLPAKWPSGIGAEEMFKFAGISRAEPDRPPKRERKDTSDWRTGKDLPDDIVDRVHLYLSVDLPEQFIVQDVENPTDWKPEISNPLDGDRERLLRWLGYNLRAYHMPEGWDMRDAGERAGVINRIPTPIMRERIEFLDGMGSALERATLGPEMVALSEAVTAVFGGEPIPRWAMVQGDPDETIEVLAKGKTISGVIGQMALTDWTALDDNGKRRLLGEFYMEDAGLETGGMVTMLPDIARVLYYDTQDILKAQGFERDSTLRLYRGLIETPDMLLPAEMDGGWVNVEISNLSPWTFSPGVAAEYATEQVGRGSILAMDVPVSMIFCNWETGPASRRWLSYLLMASRDPMKAYLYPVQRARLRNG